MILTREDLRKQLQRREIAPVYALFGAETYLRDLAAKTIADYSFTKDDFRDFNETEFSLNDTDNIKTAIAAAEQLPMMSARRVVKITELRVAATPNKDTLKEEHEELLAAYLANPSPNSVVVFVADELNGVRRIGKLLREKTVAVEFKELDDSQLTEWARSRIKDAGSEMDERTLKHLITLVGSDVRRLTNEIEKLSTAALPGKVITLDLVESLVPNSREITNFALTDNLLSRNKTKALQVMKKILDDGAEPLALLGLISYNFRRLLMAKEMMSQGADRAEVARVVKLRYSDQEPFLAAARRADTGKLTKTLERLAKTDLAIKTSIGGSGPQGARLQIEMLVCELVLL